MSVVLVLTLRMMSPSSLCVISAVTSDNADVDVVDACGVVVAVCVVCVGVCVGIVVVDGGVCEDVGGYVVDVGVSVVLWCCLVLLVLLVSAFVIFCIAVGTCVGVCCGVVAVTVLWGCRL